MCEINIEVWCPKCNSDKIKVEYNENKEDIICKCKKCMHEEILKNFDYIINKNN